MKAVDSRAANRIELLEKRVAELEKQAQEQPNIDKIVKVVNEVLQQKLSASCEASYDSTPRFNIKDLLDRYLRSGMAEEPCEDERRKQLLCELLLPEFTRRTPDEMQSYLKEIAILKDELTCKVTFSFPMEFNFLE